MTTFQVVIDSILRVISGIIPVSYPWASEISHHFLGFESKIELEFLSSLVLTVVFVLYFRFDWLGLLSALLKTVTQPSSFKKENRTLDQEVLVFLSVVSIPVFLIRKFGSPFILSQPALLSPIAYGVLFLVVAGLLRFAYRWNKRIKGLNHLRTLDAIPVILLSVLSIHPAFPLALVFWLGLALTNYHYEAVFKYSMLLLGVQTLIHFLGLVGEIGFKDSMAGVGYLNGIAALVVMFSISWWMILENLQKSMGETTYKSFQWFSVLASIGSFAFLFLKG